MSEVFKGFDEVAAHEFAYAATKKTLEGALANTDDAGRKSIIQTQLKRLSFYEGRNDPESQGKAQAIREIVKNTQINIRS